MRRSWAIKYSHFMWLSLHYGCNQTIAVVNGNLPKNVFLIFVRSLVHWACPWLCAWAQYVKCCANWPPLLTLNIWSRMRKLERPGRFSAICGFRHGVVKTQLILPNYPSLVLCVVWIRAITGRVRGIGLWMGCA